MDKKADGFWHNVITLYISSLLLCISFVLMFVTGDGVYIFLPLGSLAALFINPDLDIDGTSYAESLFSQITRVDLGKGKVAKLLGKISRGIGITLTGFWIAVWGMYGALVEHRSPLSHWPIVGTLGRVAYMCIPIFTWLYMSGANVQYEAWMPIAFAGLAIADVGHWLRDVGVLVFKEEL